MGFAREMTAVGAILEAPGHQVLYPKHTLPSAQHIPGKQEKGSLRKFEDLVLAHCKNIVESDAILILDYDKDKGKGWIGANSFLQMGFAHVLRERIYLLNAVPDFDYSREEIEAMDPAVLSGNLKEIKEGSCQALSSLVDPVLAKAGPHFPPLFW